MRRFSSPLASVLRASQTHVPPARILIPRPPTRPLSTSAPRPQYQYNRFPSLVAQNLRARGFDPRRNPNHRRWVIGVVAAGGGYYLYHLEQVPETGRWRFIDISEETERALAEESFKEVLREYGNRILPAHHLTAQHVRQVARRIVKATGMAEHADQAEGWGAAVAGGEVERGEKGGERLGRGSKLGKDIDWEVFVVEDRETKNAFVLPGGKIFVFTGILPVCANDDGLAAVLGHEVAHQVARHSAERLSGAKILLLLGFALEVLGLDFGVSRMALTFLLELPNSRKAETEADYIGLKIMARACYDPREAARMWERMAASEKKGGAGAIPLDFMSTHPANERRIRQIEEWLPEALQLRAQSDCGDEGMGRYEGFKEYASGLGQPAYRW